MTDEEKAEEYAKGKAHEHYHFLFEENAGSPIDFAKLCYLDGLAEGRKDTIQWHDLRNNPDDLPTKSGDYLCNIPDYDSDNTFYGVVNFDKHSKKFYIDEGGEPFEIIAWCEISKFEEVKDGRRRKSKKTKRING